MLNIKGYLAVLPPVGKGYAQPVADEPSGDTFVARASDGGAAVHYRTDHDEVYVFVPLGGGPVNVHHERRLCYFSSIEEARACLSAG